MALGSFVNNPQDPTKKIKVGSLGVPIDPKRSNRLFWAAFVGICLIGGRALYKKNNQDITATADQAVTAPVQNADETHVPANGAYHFPSDVFPR